MVLCPVLCMCYITQKICIDQLHTSSNYEMSCLKQVEIQEMLIYKVFLVTG